MNVPFRRRRRKRIDKACQPKQKKKKPIEPVFGWEIGLVIRPPEVLIGLTSGKKKKEKNEKRRKRIPLGW